MLFSLGVFPVIDGPCHITIQTTLMDGIFLNVVNVYDEGGLLFADISDHLTTFCVANHTFIAQHEK